jgi:hypothetical protein
MRNLALVMGLATLGLSGCVVYEHDHKGLYDEGYESDWDDGDPDADSGDVDAPDEQSFELDFYPDQVEQGELFIGYLTVAEGEFDLQQIEQL